MEKSKNRKRLTINWSIIIILIIINICLNFYLYTSGIAVYHGKTHTKYTIILLSLVSIIALLLPLISFVLGLVFALIPYKKLPFSVRYLQASALALIVVEGIFFVIIFGKYMSSFH